MTSKEKVPLQFPVRDKSEDSAPAHLPQPEPTPPELPVNEKFTLWRDEDGDYIIECNRLHQYLAADGATPDEAVYIMRGVLAMVPDILAGDPVAGSIKEK